MILTSDDIFHIFPANNLRNKLHMKLTEKRKEILSKIEESSTPLSAKMIHEQMESASDLSTVYRSLDYLEKYALVNSISLSRTRFYYSGDSQHGHFLYCRQCHELQLFDECVVSQLEQQLQDSYNYRITHHILFFEGFCKECQAYLEKKSVSPY